MERHRESGDKTSTCKGSESHKYIKHTEIDISQYSRKIEKKKHYCQQACVDRQYLGFITISVLSIQMGGVFIKKYMHVVIQTKYAGADWIETWEEGNMHTTICCSDNTTLAVNTSLFFNYAWTIMSHSSYSIMFFTIATIIFDGLDGGHYVSCLCC